MNVILLHSQVLQHDSLSASQQSYPAPQDHLPSYVRDRKVRPLKPPQKAEIDALARRTRDAIAASGPRRSGLAETAAAFVRIYTAKRIAGSGTTYVSAKFIARRTKRSRRQTQRHFAKLASMGLLVSECDALGGKRRAAARGLDLNALEALIRQHSPKDQQFQITNTLNSLVAVAGPRDQQEADMGTVIQYPSVPTAHALNALREMHRLAEPLYLILLKTTALSNAQMAKALGAGEATVRRVKARMLEEGALLETNPRSGGRGKAGGVAINPQFGAIQTDEARRISQTEPDANPIKQRHQAQINPINPADKPDQKPDQIGVMNGDKPDQNQVQAADINEYFSISKGTPKKPDHMHGNQAGIQHPSKPPQDTVFIEESVGLNGDAKTRSKYVTKGLRVTPYMNRDKNDRSEQQSELRKSAAIFETPPTSGDHTDPKSESQPENDPQPGFDPAPSDQPQNEKGETRIGSVLEGSAAGTLTWDEYRARYAMPGRSLFQLRAMAEKAGVDLPPLNLSDGTTHERSAPSETCETSNDADAQRDDDGTAEEREAWRQFRMQHWRNGIPIQSIREKARAAGVYVPAFGEPDQTTTPDWLAADLASERAAIVEYDGGLSRVDAEHMVAPSGLERTDAQRAAMLRDFW